jgi:hypothetical protein
MPFRQRSAGKKSYLSVLLYLTCPTCLSYLTHFTHPTHLASFTHLTYLPHLTQRSYKFKPCLNIDDAVLHRGQLGPTLVVLECLSINGTPEESPARETRGRPILTVTPSERYEKYLVFELRSVNLNFSS